MIKASAASTLAAALVVTGLAAPALAALEREDVLMLDADGRHYTRYQSLRSDSGERILDLAPGETIADALFIVPSNYAQSRRADGGARLRFASGNYAIMTVGRFGERISETANGDYVFVGGDGHDGMASSRGEFASYAYSWFLPANIAVVDYHANRSGEWRNSGNTLSWHGQYVKDVAFTIRYRVTPATAPERDTGSTPAPAKNPEAVAPTQAEPPTATPRPGLELKTSPRATFVIAAAPDPDPDATPASARRRESVTPQPQVRQTDTRGVELTTSPATTIVIAARAPTRDASGHGPAPADRLSLANVVALADSGRPRITEHGKAVLGRLARTLAVNNAQRVVVTGPSIADNRDTGASVAQAARVADYLAKNGLAGDRVDFKAGHLREPRAGHRTNNGVEITIAPGSALGDF